MTAEPIDEHHAPWQPDPMRQRAASYTVEDLLSLPPDAPRVELVDGVIHVVPSPTVGHQRVASLLWMWLHGHAPAHLAATQSVGVALAIDSSRQPDVLLLRGDIAPTDSMLRPEQVVLAVEVVSRSTRRTDRFAKPGEYAAAGILYYWRVEQDPVHVFAYRLADRPGPSGRREYELVTDSTDTVELSEPFDIKLPIAEITP